MLKVEMLSTGDEVLHGQIVDTNAAYFEIFLETHRKKSQVSRFVVILCKLLLVAIYYFVKYYSEISE